MIASNNDGVWNESGASLDLVLLPHFWQTWWFYPECAIAFGRIGGRNGSCRSRAEKCSVIFERMEQQNAMEQERTRIARDIHDDLGARLTKISMLTELAEHESPARSNMRAHVRNIYGTAREMLAQLDETVWAVNPRNDHSTAWPNTFCIMRRNFSAIPRCVAD